MGRRGRRKAEPTDDWELLLPLFEWPEQQAYEELRPLVLFGGSVAERVKETGTPERTIYCRVERFGNEGMLSLFGTEPVTERAKRRGLEPSIRRMIVELKAEHPALNNEITNIVYVRTGRKLGKHTAGRVLSEEVVPLKLARLFKPYHEIGQGKERRGAVVTLHLDGWSVKAIASYLRVSRMTGYRVIGSGSKRARRAWRTGPRKAEGRPQGGPRHHGLHPEDAGEPGTGRVPRPLRAGAEEGRGGERPHRGQGRSSGRWAWQSRPTRKVRGLCVQHR